MKVLRADQYATVPWRNGGGTTREIAICQDPQRHDDFLWRLSIASVTRSGPFSRFCGVDRTITLISGDPMVLRTPTQVVNLLVDAPPFTFDGEVEISCELLGQPAIDLNVMTRRSFFQHTVRRERFIGWTTVKGSADNTMVVSNGFLELSAGGRDSLRPLDAIADISPGSTLELHADCGAEIFLVELMSR